jgi:hypothetical protein
MDGVNEMPQALDCSTATAICTGDIPQPLWDIHGVRRGVGANTISGVGGKNCSEAEQFGCPCISSLHPVHAPIRSLNFNHP